MAARTPGARGGDTNHGGKNDPAKGHLVRPATGDILIHKPLPRVNSTGRSSQDNLIVFAPLNRNQAARGVHGDLAVCVAIDHGGDDGRTRTGAGAFSLADTALPNAFVDVRAVANPNEDDVSALGKLGMVFNEWAKAAPVKRREIIDEDTAVGVAHLQRGHLELLAIYDERVIDDLCYRLIRGHGNRGALEPGLAQFRAKQE